MATASIEDQSAADHNPLLKDFDFPPFDEIEPQQELEKTVEPTWPKLVEPLEKIVDRLAVVWGMVNHLKDVTDSTELRFAVEDAQRFDENLLHAFANFQSVYGGLPLIICKLSKDKSGSSTSWLSAAF